MTDFWNLSYGDKLKFEILSIKSSKQKNYFLSVFKRMEDYISEHEEDEFITFGEFFEMFER